MSEPIVVVLPTYNERENLEAMVGRLRSSVPDAGLLIVETKSDDIFVVVKLEPPQPATRDRYTAQLSKLACRQLKT